MENMIPRKLTFVDWLIARKPTDDEPGEIIALLQKRERESGDSRILLNRWLNHSDPRLHSIEGLDAVGSEFNNALRRNLEGKFSVRKYVPKTVSRYKVSPKPERAKPKLRPVEQREQAVASARQRLSKRNGGEVAPITDTTYLKALRSLGLPL
jgi:hypothetical protein